MSAIKIEGKKSEGKSCVMTSYEGKNSREVDSEEGGDVEESSDSEFEDMSFIRRLSDFTRNSAFIHAIDEFLLSRCHLVDTTLPKDENGHEDWDSFQDFQKLVNQKLHVFIVDEFGENGSEADFIERCRIIIKKDGFESQYLSILIASADFTSFVELLRSKLESVESTAYREKRVK